MSGGRHPLAPWGCLVRLSRPSLGTVLGGLALFVALSGTAWAVAATKVNIADPTTPSQIAHVDAGGHLQIAGTVTDQLATPANYVNDTNLSLSGGTCIVIATPAKNKAIVVRQVTFDVFQNPSPGSGNFVTLFVGPKASPCGTIVGDDNPSGIGAVVMPFDPGLGVPKGDVLAAQAGGAVGAESFVNGYTVSAGQVPALAHSTRHASTQHP